MSARLSQGAPMGVRRARTAPVDWRRLLRAADGPARLLMLFAVVLAFVRIFLN